MDEDLKYLLVEAKILPDIFPKIIEVKRLLSKGSIKSVNDGQKLNPNRFFNLLSRLFYCPESEYVSFISPFIST